MTQSQPAEHLEETPDDAGAFPRLAPQHIDLLRGHGTPRATESGEVLVHEGRRERDFMVILAGQVVAAEGYGTRHARVIRVHGPGRFIDELSLLTRQPSFVTWVVREPGEVLAVPLSGLRRAVGRDPKLGDLIVSALIIRRELLIGRGSGVTIVGSRYSPDTRRLRELAARNRVPFRWIDLEEDEQAASLLEELGIARTDTPVVIWAGSRVLRNPGNAELAREFGFPVDTEPGTFRDLVVVGAGPSGLAAAVYGASEGLSTVVLDSVAAGGQAGTSSRIENYLGFPAGISGGELADRAVIQAEKFGAHISVPVGATDLDQDGGYYTVRLDDGNQISSRTVVIATGARYRRLPVLRLEEFEGKSVYYAATLMEARHCGPQPVVVVGGGNSAGQATVFLSQHASKVYLLIRDGDLSANMSRYLIDQITDNPQVEVLLNAEVRELVGDDGELEAVVAEDNRNGQRRRLDAGLLFVFIGAEPCTGWLGRSVALDGKGFVLTGADLPNANGSRRQVLETSLPGVLAVGDVRSGSIKRVASAVGEGSMAVRLIHEHLARTNMNR
jgi:thioredoxin reductase (NADPH)